MKIIVAGGRDFNDRSLMAQKLNAVCKQLNITKPIIISGCARGADSLGASIARASNIPVEEYPAEWDIYGKRAGYLRNEDMGNEADILVAFWSGSNGTKHMIDYMHKLDKPVFIQSY